MICRFKLNNMKQLLWALSYLCLENISINIRRFCCTSKKNWQLIHNTNLGDRLMACVIANSSEESVDEQIYEFIVENLGFKELKIYQDVSPNLKCLDFLNHKFVEKLSLRLTQRIKLSNYNYNLSVDRLDLVILKNMRYNEDMFVFFGNISVNKEIKVSTLVTNEENITNITNFILALLKNASNELQTVNIDAVETTNEFRMKIAEALEEKKNLKNVHLSFLDKLPTDVLVNLHEKSFRNTNRFSMMDFRMNWDFRLLQMYLNSISSLEQLIFWWPSDGPVADLEEKNLLYSILKSKHSFSLKEIEILLLDAWYEKDICAFLESCHNLRRIVLSGKRKNKTSKALFDSLVPSAKSLKDIVIKVYHLKVPEDITSLNVLLSNSSLRELTLFYVDFEEGLFQEFLKALVTLPYSLVSITIYFCNILVRELRLFPKTVRMLHRLKTISLYDNQMDEEIISDLMESLISSSMTLQNITICHSCKIRELKNCEKFITLFKNCDNLQYLNLNVSLRREKVGELLVVLKKFQHIMKEIDLTFCYSYEKFDELLDFLSGCVSLERVYGHPKGVIRFSDSILNYFDNSKYSLKKITLPGVKREYHF